MSDYNKFSGKAPPPFASLARHYWRTKRYLLLLPAALAVWSLALLVSYIASSDDPQFTLEKYNRDEEDMSTATLEKNPTPFKPVTLNPLPPQSEIFTWPFNIRRPLCMPKIFVYPDSPRMGEFQITEVPFIGTDYISEEILLKQLRDKESGVYKNYVTENPEEADFFYIPFLGAKYLSDCQQRQNMKGDCDVDEKYAALTMNYVQQDYPYWNRSSGKDHIMAHPMDEASLYYKSKDRMQNATFLTTVGDKRVIHSYDGRTRRYEDIVIPSANALLDVENVNPAHYLREDGQPKAGRRNIFMLFAGHNQDVKPGDGYSGGVRALLFNGFNLQPDYKIATKFSDQEHIEFLTRAKYGFAPRGYTHDSTLIWEYIAFGVVPVVIADGIIEPFEDDLDWDSFIVKIRRQDAHKMDVILRSISAEEYESKRQAVWNHGRQALLDHDAWNLIVRGLCRKAHLEGMQTIDREQHVSMDKDITLQSRPRVLLSAPMPK